MNELPLIAFSDQLADAIAGVAPSVVQVYGRRRPASGIVFGDGLVLTTTRALGRDDGLRVRTADGHLRDAELGGWDPTTSLVVLKAVNLGVASAVPSETPPRVGHLTLAVARSWSNALTATAGIVSVIGGPLPTGPGRAIDRVIRTTAPMHSGFAGGAVIDATGKIMGVATAAEIRGLGVVIPADIAWKAAAGLAEHGTLNRGYLGVAGQQVRLSRPQPDAEDRANGFLITEVSPQSPAELGGILVGDVMIGFDAASVESPLDLLGLLHSDRIGREVHVRLLRGGVLKDLSIVVGSRPPR